MPSWTKYYPENVSFILHMVQKLLQFEFCQKLAKIAFCQLQARSFQLWTQISYQRKKQSDWNLDSLDPLTQISHFIFSFHWKCLVVELTFAKNVQKCIFRGCRWLFGELWNKCKWLNLPKLLSILFTSNVSIQ